MIVLRKEEKIRHKFRVKLDGFGKGDLYVTSQRLVFEADKYGACLNLELNFIHDWKPTKGHLVLRWKEKDDSGRLQSTIFHAKIKMEKDGKKRKTPRDLHFAIYYAHVEAARYGWVGLGYGVDEKGDMYHRYFYHTDSKPISKTSDVEFVYSMLVEHEEDRFLLKRCGLPHSPEDLSKFSKDHESFEERFNFFVEHSDMSPEVQDVLKRRIMLRAYEHDGGSRFGKSGIPESFKKDQSDPDSYKVAVQMADAYSKEISQYEQESNTAKLTEKNDAGNTLYECRDGWVRLIDVWKRGEELLDGVKFEFQRQVEQYRKDLDAALLDALKSGQDISTYNPQIEKIPSAIPIAEQRIAELEQKYPIVH